MSDAMIRLPGQNSPSKAAAFAVLGLGAAALMIWKAAQVRELEDDITALTAVALLVAAVMAEIALFFADRRDWLVLDETGLSMPRFWRGAIPLTQLANAEVIEPQGSRKTPMLRIGFKTDQVVDFARPALCPRRLRRRVTGVVMTKPGLLGTDIHQLADQINHAIQPNPGAAGADMVIAQKPQNTQGSLAGVAVVFGMAMIATALLRTI